MDFQVALARSVSKKFHSLSKRRCGSGTHLGRAVLAGDPFFSNCRIGSGFQLVVHISYMHLFWTDSVWNFPVVVWVWVVATIFVVVQTGQVAFPIYFPESSHVVSQLEAPEAPEGGTMA